MSNTEWPEPAKCAIYPHKHQPLRITRNNYLRRWECDCIDCGHDDCEEGDPYPTGEGHTPQLALEDYAERSGVELARITHTGERHV